MSFFSKLIELFGRKAKPATAPAPVAVAPVAPAPVAVKPSEQAIAVSPPPAEVAPVVAHELAPDIMTPRVDPVVPSGTPGTVTLPKTGHVLSLPQPGPEYGKGEMFVGYCIRVHKQCGASNLNAIGGLFLGTGFLFDPIGGFKEDGSNWPEAADRWYNYQVYYGPPAEQSGWDAVHDALKARGKEAEPPKPTNVPISED